MIIYSLAIDRIYGTAKVIVIKAITQANAEPYPA
jgi:hypothetical protein